MRKHEKVFFILILIANILLGLDYQDVQAAQVKPQGSIYGCETSNGILTPDGQRYNLFSNLVLSPTMLPSFFGKVSFDGTNLIFHRATEPTGVPCELRPVPDQIMVDQNILLITDHKTFCAEGWAVCIIVKFEGGNAVINNLAQTGLREALVQKNGLGYIALTIAPQLTFFDGPLSCWQDTQKVQIPILNKDIVRMSLKNRGIKSGGVGLVSAGQNPGGAPTAIYIGRLSYDKEEKQYSVINGGCNFNSNDPFAYAPTWIKPYEKDDYDKLSFKAVDGQILHPICFQYSADPRYIGCILHKDGLIYPTTQMYLYPTLGADIANFFVNRSFAPIKGARVHMLNPIPNSEVKKSIRK